MIFSVTVIMLCMMLGYAILGLLFLRFLLKRFSVNVPYIVASFILMGILLFQQVYQGRVIMGSIFIMVLIAAFVLDMVSKQSKKSG
ncbi:hypothetical protein AV654_32280 [Paenibacillus elgii]|uniref:Uncharacterized protein n=1 Tax=Paenibacillus elgii TaxID=189691 RepID=A0A163ULD3_9BACL|nr:hypothetical protein AV654_32280 [Paenibacillus elgii]PUA38176.1 hypothetical protein C8Z91_15740 [Paenibacillus elgii]